MSELNYTCIGDGVGRFRVTDIHDFIDVLGETDRFPAMGGRPEERAFIYRGQWEEEGWRLVPKLDRYARACGRSGDASFRDEQLERFKLAARGTLSGSSSAEWSDLALWVLGQHYGLATPLLDWTLSPFVAAFFALWKSGPERHRRVVYAYDQRTGKGLNADSHDATVSVPHVAVYKAPDSQNERLVAQQGLFTHATVDLSLEKYVEYAAEKTGTAGRSMVHLVEVVLDLDADGREKFLRYLNLMNVNHRTLFPDLMGASMHCNMALEIEGY